MIPVRSLAVLLLVVLPAIPGAAASGSAANPVRKVTERLQPGAATAESCNPDIDPLQNNQDMELLQLVSAEKVQQIPTPAPSDAPTSAAAPTPAPTGAPTLGDWFTVLYEEGKITCAESWQISKTVGLCGKDLSVFCNACALICRNEPNCNFWFQNNNGACYTYSSCFTTRESFWRGITYYWNAVPTPAPSDAPTSAAASTPAPTGAPTLAHAVGDPHLTNVLGQRFDLTQPGKHVFILIPKGADAQDTLLRVDADIEHIGSACADMYIQYLTITGQWADEQRIGGYHYDAQEDAGRKGTNWMHVGEVDLKVVWGRTIEGIKYMNLFAKKLGKTGFPVGGLLGEDDHTFASTPTEACQTTVSLTSGASQAHGGSTAEADF